MTTQQTALIAILAEQAEARVKELVDQAKLEFYEAADRAFAQALECYFRPFRGETDNDPRNNGCCVNHRVAG